MTSESAHGSEQHHARLAVALSRWIDRAGVANAVAVGDLAVGMADIVYAAARAGDEIRELLRLDPSTAEGAVAALERLGFLRAQFVTEILVHAQELEARWGELESALSAERPTGGSSRSAPAS